MTMSQHSTPPSVLFVGCGQVSTELGHHLVSAGAKVYGLRRNPSILPDTFHQVPIDLLEPVDQPLPNVDAMVITLTPSMPSVEGTSGYLVALQHLADALPRVPDRVVFVSSTRVFEGHRADRALTEADAVAPVSARGETLVAGEQLAIELFGAHIVRPAGIYGPGREMLLRKVLTQEPVQYARQTNRVHQTDLARALHLMLTVDTPPAILHAIDQAPGVLLGDVVEYIAAKLNVAAPPRIEPAESTGRVLSGDLLSHLLGSLTYPTYQQGYDQIIANRETKRAPES